MFSRMCSEQSGTGTFNWPERPQSSRGGGHSHGKAFIYGGFNRCFNNVDALWAIQTTQGTFNHFRFSKVQFPALLSLSAAILTRLASAITSAPTINTTISANHSLINDIFKVLLCSSGVPGYPPTATHSEKNAPSRLRNSTPRSIGLRFKEIRGDTCSTRGDPSPSSIKQMNKTHSALTSG